MTALLMLLGVFLLIGAGGMLIVALQSGNRTYLMGTLVAVIAGIVSILVGMTLVSVGPNERMVVFNRITGNLGNPREPGIHIVNPITTSFRIYDISRQSYTMSAAYAEGDVLGDDSMIARTAGGQEVRVDLTVIYSINPTQINDVHVNWPNDRYRNELIRPLLRSVIRDAISQFAIETIYQERDTIDQTITESVLPAMEQEGFFVQDILVRELTFTPEYAAAIEAAQIAEVNAREEEFRIQGVEQQAEQVQARARGEAEARKIQAEAEAEALRLLAEVLEQNPSLIQYLYVQNLSDNIQILALPASSPFIFDLGNIADLPTAPPPPAGDN